MVYSIGPNDYAFLSFAENIVKICEKNIDQNLSGKYSQKILDTAKWMCFIWIRDSFKIAIQSKSRSEWWFHRI